MPAQVRYVHVLSADRAHLRLSRRPSSGLRKTRRLKGGALICRAASAPHANVAPIKKCSGRHEPAKARPVGMVSMVVLQLTTPLSDGLNGVA